MILRAPREDDIDALHALINQAGVRIGSGRMPFQPRAWVEARVMARDPLVTSLVAELDGQVTGWSSLVRNTGRMAHSAIFGISVHEAFQGRGIGRAMMAALMDVADNWLGLVRVELTCNADNARAIGLYQSFGFETEGRLRAHLIRDGQLIDSLIMGRITAAPERTAAQESVA